LTGEACGIARTRNAQKHTTQELAEKLSVLDGPRREFLKEALAEIASAAVHPAASTRSETAVKKASETTAAATRGSRAKKGNAAGGNVPAASLRKGFLLPGGRKKAQGSVKEAAESSRVGQLKDGKGDAMEAEAGIAARIRNLPRRAAARSNPVVVSSQSSAGEEQVVMCTLHAVAVLWREAHECG